MCLDVDPETTTLREATPRARKPHKCYECGRTIEVGEKHKLWVVIDWGFDNDLHEWRMCVHCWATIELGHRLTGCPRNWYWDMVHDLGEDGGFVGDILLHPTLGKADRLRMLRTHVGRRRRWLRRDGSMLDPIIDPFTDQPPRNKYYAEPDTPPR